MSVSTVAQLVYRVRQLIDKPGFTEGPPVTQVLANLDRAYLWVRSELPAKLDYSATFLTLAAGTATYTLTETDPQALTGFRLASDGWIIRKVPLETLQIYRIGNPVASGLPILIAFEEAESGVVTAHLWPTPSTADTVTATVSDGPNITFEGQASTDLTALSLNMGIWGAEALIYFAASLMGGDFMQLALDMRAKESERIMGAQANPNIELTEA